MDASADQTKNMEVPILPNHLQQAINELGGTTPVWLMEKMLAPIDVNRFLGKMFFPHCEALEEFMTDEEKEVILTNDGKIEGLTVTVVASSHEQWEVGFIKWERRNQYVFTKQWKTIIFKMLLVPLKETIQIWCFRLPAERDSKLCFAIHVKPTPEHQLASLEPCPEF